MKSYRGTRLAQAQVKAVESRPPDSGSWVEAGLWQAACKLVYCGNRYTFYKFLAQSQCATGDQTTRFLYRFPW